MNPMRLVLFFTRGVSLKTWDEVGMFEREVALYRSLQKRGVRVAFVTYGDASDLTYCSQLPGIRILCNRWGLPGRMYESLLPWLHASELAHAGVFKSNQTNGVEIALQAAKVWRKPLIARCGYMWSDLASQAGMERQTEAKRACLVENLVFNAAPLVVVTTPKMRDYVVRNYNLAPEKVRVIPNYVLSDLFVPNGTELVPNRLSFIGRLGAEKNPLALVEACVGLDVELVMIGEGPLRSAIAEKSASLGVNLHLAGNLPHRELPAALRKCALFLLVSPYEGHPKTLLEAMACGLPVIGADSPGIRELIRHGENGWLCGTDSASIHSAIRELLARPDLRAKLGCNARQFVVENFALERIVEMELALLHEVVG